MKNHFLLFAFFLISSLSIFGQDYQIEWGNIERGSGQIISIIPKSGKDFYTLRWTGGTALGSYRLSKHINFSITATGKLQMKLETGMANFEGVEKIGDRLLLFLSDRTEGINHFYMQEYDEEMQVKGASKELAQYEIEKGKSKGFFNIIKSRDSEYFGVVWEIPGKKEQKDEYGFKIFDKDLKEISDGQYKLPYQGKLSSIQQHYLSNTGDYFISVLEFSEPEGRKLFKNYLDYKATHILQITPEGIEDMMVNLEGKRVEAMTMSSDNDHVFTITGICGDQGKAGVTGLFYLRTNFDKKEIINEGFEKFGKDFIVQDWTNKQKNRADIKEQKGKGEPQLYNYTMRQSEVLNDGSFIGSIEQYYVVVTTYSDPKFGTRTTYTYYYNDIIAFKVGADGGFDWLKKIKKYQVSNNDGGPFSSYSQFLDKGNLNFIFNDNSRNYEESGVYIDGNPYPANFGKRRNTVAIVSLNIETGEISRRPLFNRKDISAIAVPKMFYVDYKNKEVLLYSVYGKNERYGILKLN